MWRLSECLRFYVHERLSGDAAWRGLAVVLSDASVPGEGEHKIMDFVRRQRASPRHDPNTHHVLCGADGTHTAQPCAPTLPMNLPHDAADLIMLGLATHEPQFTIVREEFLPNQQRPCELCGRFGECEAVRSAWLNTWPRRPRAARLPGPGRRAVGRGTCAFVAQHRNHNHSSQYGEVASPVQRQKNFVFIRLSVLREYLQRELFMPNLPFRFDFEVRPQFAGCRLALTSTLPRKARRRRLGLHVLLCRQRLPAAPAVAGDQVRSSRARPYCIPHTTPHTLRREGAIDRLVKLYKDCVYRTKVFRLGEGCPL